MTRDELALALPSANVQAFLRLIRRGEGTSDADGYRRLFGGKLFSDFSAHPNTPQTYALRGRPTTSSAAGAYQILKRTWNGLVAQYGFKDFTPETQDLAAIALIAGRAALADVQAGRLDAALQKCCLEWASLPGAPYGQPTLSLVQARELYDQAGGTLLPAMAQPEEQPMPPFVLAALPSLLSHVPDLIRLFGDSPVAERNAKAAQQVVDIAKAVTGQATAEAAVNALDADPTLVANFQSQARADFLDIAALIDKRVEAARTFNATEAPLFSGLWGHWKFVHLLSAVMILGSYAGGYLVLTGDFSSDLKASVVTLMLVGGFTAVAGYWLGSSNGSDRKTELVLQGRAAEPPNV